MAIEKVKKVKKVFVIILSIMVGHFGLLQGQTESSRKIELKDRTAMLQDIFNQVELQTGLITMFSNDILDAKREVTLDKQQISLGELYSLILSGTNLNHEIKGKYIVIVQQAETPPPPTRVVKIYTGKVTDIDNEPLVGVTIICSDGGKGQGITNMDGEFKIAILKEAEDLKKSQVTLKFSYVGMLPHEEIVADATNGMVPQIYLLDDTKSLDEVVVTGYQAVSRRDMVGAVTTIQAKDVMMASYSSIDQMLQGVVPGMVVTNSSSRVGTSPKIQIRGNATLMGDGQPIWVVDGIIQEETIKMNATTALTEDLKNILGSQISWLNPQDIETITVLKDASATAIYGSKASNGVIVVTTKQSKGDSERISINYNGNISLSTKPNYGQFNLMNSQERMKFSDDAFGAGIPYGSVPYLDMNTYEGLQRMMIEGYISNAEYQKQRSYLEGVNTDWFDLLTRNAISQNHNLSIMGGSRKVNYATSIGYTNQQGQEIGNDSRRYTARISTGIKLNKKMNLTVALTGSSSTTSGYGSGVSPIGYATSTSRAIPAYDDRGNYSYYQKVNAYQHNKLNPTLNYNILNEMEQTSSTQKNIRLAASADFKYMVLPWLTYNFTGGYNISDNEGQTYMSEQSFYTAKTYRGYNYGLVDPQSADFKAAILPFGGEYFTNDARQSSYNIQNKLNITKEFRDKDRLNILVGHEIRSTLNTSTANTVYGFSKERGEQIILPTLPGNLQPVGTGAFAYTGYGVLAYPYSGRWKRLNTTDNFMSLFATAAYSINNKYVFNASVRNDFSNRFGQNINRRIDPTYSFGTSWDVAGEEFVKNYLGFISRMNIRATYGIQGNALTNMSPEMILYKQAVMAVFEQYYSTIASIPNPNLSWERTTNWNFGTDIQLFRKLNLNVDYYTRRSNAIISQDVPLEYGIASVNTNGGILYNRGIEGSLSFSPINTNDLGLAVSINSSRNWNTGGETTGTILLNHYLNGKAGSILKEGYPVNGFWSYSFDKLDPTTGSPIFNLMDVDKEDAIADKTSFLVYSGENAPSFTGGLSLNLRYKSFSVSSSFSMLLGAKKRLANPFANFSSGSKLPSADINLSKTLNERWMKPGDELTTVIPSINVDNAKFVYLPDGQSFLPLYLWSYSSAMVVDASFLRCRSIDLNWRVDPKIINKANLRSLTLTASVNNLFVIASKRFNGFDPELDESVLPKTISIGFALGL